MHESLRMKQPAILALADGSIFEGESVGAEGSRVGEVVFNTAMTGYQEILTDPSYARQLVLLTHPHVGNTGCNADDVESGKVQAAGLIVRDVPRRASSWRATESLGDYLVREDVVAIAGIDTRAVTRRLREQGAQGGCLQAGATQVDRVAAVAAAQAFAGMSGMDLAREVSRRQPEAWRQGRFDLDLADHRTRHAQGPHVVVYDFGVKHNILRLLVEQDCQVTVVPATTTFEEAMDLAPDGILLANGPGDPGACQYAIDATRRFIADRIPVFGICLGHQILGLAAGARTVKMKFGHHGANHPVLRLATGSVAITSQNHGFAVDIDSLPANVEVTHRSLFDDSLQGIRLTDAPAFGFQGHPEASPGPQELSELFVEFLSSMREGVAHGTDQRTALLND